MNDTRGQKYAEAIDNLTNHLVTDWQQWLEDVTAAVVAVADDEQAELRAASARVTELSNRWAADFDKAADAGEVTPVHAALLGAAQAIDDALDGAQ